MRRTGPLSVVLALAAVLAAGWGVLLPRGAAERPPHVIIYMIDTLRADRLSAYGYDRNTSPQLDAFAREAVLFRRAYAQSSWTKPSIASLFTGLFPSRHGAVGKEHRIRASAPMLSELLERHGYTTAAFVSNPNVLPPFGFGRGFGKVVDIGARAWATGRIPAARAAAVHEEVFRYLDGAPAGPLFLYIHVLDPHAPYAAPHGPFRKAFFPENRELSERERIQALYDGEVAYVDDVFAGLVSRLKRDRLYDNAIIAVLSDHGEEFWEHGGIGHGHSLHEELLWVPLILRLPGGARGGLEMEQPVRLVDLMPTIAELLEIESPEGIDGSSFASLLSSGNADASYDPLLYAELAFGEHTGQALIDDGYKLIRRSSPEPGQTLFRLSDDALEQLDLSSTQPTRLATLAKRLEAVEGALYGGLYVELRNGLDPAAAHRLEGTIESLGGTFVTATALDHAEAFRVAPDRQSIAFDLRFVNQPSTVRQDPPVVMDVARLKLDVEAVRLSLRLDGEPLDGSRVLLGANEQASGGWPLELRRDDPRLRLESPGSLSKPPVLDDSSPYCLVYFVPSPTSETVEVDASVLDRLEALGYAEP